MTMSTASNYYARRLFQQRRLNHGAVDNMRKAVAMSGAPPSISSILDTGIMNVSDDKSSMLNQSKDAAAFIRQVGCTRRVFLFRPHLTAQEMEGLAYRVKTLTKNDSINSVLIATDDRDDSDALPSSLVDLDYPYLRGEEAVDMGFPPAPGHTWHVSSGYDALELWKSGDSTNPEAVEYLLSSLGQLALATRGDNAKTKVPVITMPHGAVQDGGFALCMASYVIATNESTYRIMNPSRGLSLDPVGLSYTLPRMGREFRQPAADYKGCGIIMGCMGFEADASDMIETGMATNFVETPVALGLFEKTLSEIKPWFQQTITKIPKRFHGEPDPQKDHNAEFRNVAVADAVHSFTSYRADGTDMWVHHEQDAHIFSDPALDTDMSPMHEDRTSDLVNYAATFDHIFTKETTLQGILEGLQEIAARDTNDLEEQEGIDVAADFVRRLQSQSPLAACATYRLLGLGSNEKETLATCMEREKRVQAKLLAGPDFQKWAKYATRHTGDEAPLRFAGWEHNSIADVPNDQILELVGSS
jgi:enoyl-CoA hydratase/carnithine racemase